MAVSRKPLLAKLAPMFGSQTENLAVEALGHILSGSETARHALSLLLQDGGADVGRIARVQTQASGDDGARPDLVGCDRDGKERVLIEAKFWASLTENQPNGYLRRLAEPRAQRPCALLFVAPEMRMDSLWAELRREVATSASGLALTEPDGAEGLPSALAGEGRHLMLTSWRNLLNRMATAVSGVADSHTETDIRQLQGLAELEDDEAFLPLRREELGPQVPRRIRDLTRLVDDAIYRAVKTDWASMEQRRMVATATRYGVWLRFSQAETVFETADAFFGIDHALWARHRDTPLWLVFSSSSTPPELRRTLEPLLYEDPPKLIGETGEDMNIPVELPTGKEYGAVREAGMACLAGIARQIGPCGQRQATATPPPQDD